MSGTVLTKDAYPSLTNWFLNLMLTWHRNDPVSQKEIDRNAAVSIAQGNRNPYIDYPDLVEHVWGNKKTEAWYANRSGLTDEEVGRGFAITPVPAYDYVTVTHTLNGEMSYWLYSVTGVLMNQGTLQSGNQIDVSHCDNGIYLLQIRHKETITTHKIVVKH